MAGEWFRALKTISFLGISRDDPTPGMPTYGMPGLDTVLAEAGVLEALTPLLDRHTQREPLHVTLRDLGFTSPSQTPRILVLELVACQVDAGLNEIPRATCSVAVGRAAFSPDSLTPSLTGGATDGLAASIIHVLERYLTSHVAMKIFAYTQTTAWAGFGDAGDNRLFPDEPYVLFDGFATGPTRRGSDTNMQMVLHLSHFLAALTFSSTLSSSVSAGSAIPAIFSTGAWPGLLAGLGVPLSPFGAVASVMAGQRPLYVDFWGYQVPASGQALPQMGVKGFLDNLAQQDLFNWENLKKGNLDAAACNNRVVDALKNNRALAALRRIEPIWPNWNAIGGGAGGANAASAVWNSIDAALVNVRAARSRAADRADLTQAVGAAYQASGYMYGVPVGFYTSIGNELAVNEPSRAFAADILYSSVESLAPVSFWDLLGSAYPARYQIAIAPMADRAVVIPAAPVLDGVWQSIYASEIFGWSDDVQTPTPVRGVILMASRASGAGALTSGYTPLEAGFDSCEPGVFVLKQMPAWLTTMHSIPGALGGKTVAGPKNAAGAPWTTAPNALAAVGGNAVTFTIGKPSAQSQTTANRLAKSLWQQERLRYRSISVTGRFRVDIGPGSHVNVELPMDRYVGAGLGAQRDNLMRGMVVRVQHNLDAEGRSSSTAFQLGFTRTEGELIPNQPLYGNSHPIWQTAVYGIPWCDMTAMRDQLGDGATIANT